VRIDWAILCKFVEVTDGLATIVGAGIDNIQVPGFPIAVPLQVCIRIVGLPDNEDHNLRVQLLDEQMEPVLEPLETTFKMDKKNPQHPPGWEAQAIQPLRVQFEAKAAGAHTLDISVDGTSRTLSFLVRGP
jgi:hypothetical protein